MCTDCACSAQTVSGPQTTAPADASTIEYRLEGVTCGGCASTVTKAVEALGRVTAEVDVAARTLTVSGDEVDDQAVRAAVSAAGYGIA